MRKRLKGIDRMAGTTWLILAAMAVMEGITRMDIVTVSPATITRTTVTAIDRERRTTMAMANHIPTVPRMGILTADNTMVAITIIATVITIIINRNAAGGFH